MYIEILPSRTKQTRVGRTAFTWFSQDVDPQVVIIALFFSYTTSTAFHAVLEEVVSLANQHEVIADGLNEQVCREITGLVKELKEERKKVRRDGYRGITQGVVH